MDEEQRQDAVDAQRYDDLWPQAHGDENTPAPESAADLWPQAQEHQPATSKEPRDREPDTDIDR